MSELACLNRKETCMLNRFCFGAIFVLTTLTAPAQTGVAFGGWTYNYTPTPITATGPNSCQIVLGATNATVGAIFN